MKIKVSAAGFVFFLFAFFVMSTTPCLASVTGTITDTAGSPVSGALVTFTDESDTDKEFSDYTDSDGMYKLPISPVHVTEETPANFQLYQNYPNPFNPSTTIPFSLNEAGYVNLSIYNVTGQKIRTLVDNYHFVGTHTVTWKGLDDTGKSVAAGIYIYQLKFGDTVESRKMLLIDGGSKQIVTRTTVRAKSVKDAENTTYLVTIIGDDIEPYEESGITIVDGGTYDFVVVRKTSEIHGITFVSIPGGTFQMGDVENAGSLNEKPVHTVTVSGFDMSTTEITNEQYAVYLNEALTSGDIEIKDGDVYGKTGELSGERYLDIGYEYNSDNKCWINYSNGTFPVTTGKEKWPVVAVTWYGSKAFALYYGLDLPTEAEWEYAARGGKQYKYGTDDGTIDKSKANFDYVLPDGYPVDVGSYPANPYGLYDMSGNLWEWCNDWYDDYSSDSVSNPTGALTGSDRVVRGGGWHFDAISCRSAVRGPGSPGDGFGAVGFRVVVRKTSEIHGITFVTIPGGTFEMGDEDGEWYWCLPVHTVTVSGFAMSTTEITNEQYAAYLNEALASGDIKKYGGNVRGETGDYNGKVYINLDGYHSSDPGNDCKIVYSSGSFDVKSGYEKWPVTWVTWYGSKLFAQYYGLDLPTEAEWEYAARGGKQYKYGTDDGTISDSKANYDRNTLYPVDVGTYPSNPFGLKDMSGNVFDWCNDWYDSDYYDRSPSSNPTGPNSGSLRVARGGNWYYDAGLGFCRSARRADSDPGYGSGGLGFRVVSR